MVFFWLSSSCNIMAKDCRAHSLKPNGQFYLVIHSLHTCSSTQIINNACSWKENSVYTIHQERNLSHQDEQMHLDHPSHLSQSGHLSQHGTLRHQVTHSINSANWESMNILWNQQNLYKKASTEKYLHLCIWISYVCKSISLMLNQSRC